MSILQFVILLVVIFVSTNTKNIAGIYHNIKRRSFRRKVARLQSILEKYCSQTLLFKNEFEGKIAICLAADWNEPGQQGGFVVVEPTFVFYQRDSKKIEEKFLLIIGDFLFEVCQGELPLAYFSGKVLQSALGRNFTQNKKTLLVPEKVPPFEIVLGALNKRLQMYPQKP